MDMDIDMDVDMNVHTNASRGGEMEEAVSVNNPRNMMVMQLSIVVDAANVCWSYLRSLPGFAYAEMPARFRPPLHGLLLCLQFFQSHGVRPVAVCPQWWSHTEVQGVWKDNAFEQEDFGIFKRLRNESVLFCAPSGDHDDLYLIDYANRTNGFIVSNDKFRDHRESRGLSASYVQNRKITYMWINNEFIPNPDDISRIRVYLLKKEQPNVPTYTTSIPSADGLATQPPTIMHHNIPAIPKQMAQAPPPLPSQAHIQHAVHQPISHKPAHGSDPGHVPGPTGLSVVQRLQSETQKVRIQVPTECVKFIIGKGGSKIQQLEQVSGSRISVVKPSLGDRTDVDIIGASAEASRAKELIEEIVRRVQSSASSSTSSSTSQPIIIAKTDPINKSNMNTDKDLTFMFDDLDIKEAPR